MKKTVLITGGTGFIGHYLVKEFVKDHNVICLIRPGTKNLIRLDDVKDQILFVEHDIRESCDPILEKLKGVQIILHAGGNPSSEDSIKNTVSVVMDNVIGTTHLLELSKKLSVERFFYYSAGEVFGSVGLGKDSHENDPYNTVSPYAAVKIAGEELCIAYSRTFDIPVSITHITNTFGPMSQANRLPVIIINKLLNGEEINLHIDEHGQVGGRRWLYAGDVASQTRYILTHQIGKCEKWNSSGRDFINNFELADKISNIMNKELSFKFSQIERLGHGTHFSPSPDKIYKAGWTEPLSFDIRLKETVEWYLKNPEWLTRN